jgi:voltage-gated sodium channel
VEHQQSIDASWRGQLRMVVDGRLFQGVVIGAICLNAILLGMETFPLGDTYRPYFMVVDRIFVAFFVFELVLRLLAAGIDYFRSPWNIADFLIIVGSLLAVSNLFTAFRAFRILRVLRVVTVIPRMRVVVRALFDAVPGILSVAVVAMLIIYIFGVIAATLYGGTHEALFGDIFTAMYTLFQVITLEGWRDIADDVSQEHPQAWIFFVVFVLVGTFTMLNLFIAIVVRVVEEEADETEDFVRAETNLVLDELKRINARLDRVEGRLPTAPTVQDTSPDPASR